MNRKNKLIKIQKEKKVIRFGSITPQGLAVQVMIGNKQREAKKL